MANEAQRKAIINEMQQKLEESERLHMSVIFVSTVRRWADELARLEGVKVRGGK